MNVTRALIIKKHWLDLILSGEKTWEIRGSNTTIRGKIGLIESGSGLVVGECELVDSIKLDPIAFHENSYKHLIGAPERPYKSKTHAWVLNNAKRYDKPMPYKHLMGAVIWVKLEGDKWPKN